MTALPPQRMDERSILRLCLKIERFEKQTAMDMHHREEMHRGAHNPPSKTGGTIGTVA